MPAKVFQLNSFIIRSFFVFVATGILAYELKNVISDFLTNPIATYVYEKTSNDRKIPDILICNPSFPLNIDRFFEHNLTQADYDLIIQGMMIDAYRRLGDPEIENLLDVEVLTNNTQSVRRMLADLNDCRNSKI